MTSKVTDTATYDYAYNLQGRLASVDNGSGSAGFAYNPSGIRIAKTAGATTTDYLIDPSNHTGYAQVLEETTSGVRTTYTIGDDIIAQSTSGVTDYLLYDGHGSTRQLVDSTGAIVSGQEYSYDGYGVMLSDSTTSGAEAAAAADTKMLYAGEQYDASASMYYNRARYYNPANGTFNRVDPYSGNAHDPQSLHKYAYCHNNPINGTDPSGLFFGGGFSMTGLMITVAIGALLGGIIGGAITKSWKGALYGVLIGAAIGAAAYAIFLHWPQLVKAFTKMINYQRAHRTVSDRVFRRMFAKSGTDVGTRLRFFNHLRNLSGGKALWLRQFTIGVGQKLLMALRHPIQFLQWLNPTPAAMNLSIALGVVIYIVWINRDNINEFINEWRK